MDKKHLLVHLFLYGLLIGATKDLAYVYHVQQLYNAHSHQHIILLSDYHEKNRHSTTQRLALLDAAKKHGAYLISEDQEFLYQDISATEVIAYQPCLQPLINDLIADPVHFNANTIYPQDYVDLDPATEGDNTPLFLITPMAQQRGIKAATAERRQAEIISSNGGPISAADVCKAYDKIIQDIENYDDDALYNAFYRQAVLRYKQHISLLPHFLTYLRSSDTNLQQAYTDKSFAHEALACYEHIYKQDTNITIEPEEDIYEKLLCALYLFLVDTAIVHEIAQHEQQQVIIIYAGGTHIETVIPVLQSHGYDLVYEQGVSRSKPINLHSCFNIIASSLPAAQNIFSHKTLQNYWLTILEKQSEISIWRELQKFLA